MKTSFMGIPGIKLLQIMDQAVANLLAAREPFVADTPADTNHPATYIFTRGHHWVAACGSLAVSGFSRQQGRCVVPCDLIVGPEGTQMRLDGDGSTNFSERLKFPTEPTHKQDLNYQEVSNRIQNLGIDEAVQAEGMLFRMAGQAHVQTRSGCDFLNALVALMFGVESSRNQASMATSLMLLDLISQRKTYGSQGVKPFTLASAFHSKHEYRWDDGEFGLGSFYGGKYPMAVHGTGAGNMAERYGMVRNQLAQNLHILQRQAVPNREISLLVHWLEANLSQPNQRVDENWISSTIAQRLEKAYYDIDPTWRLVGNPNRYTGVKVPLQSDHPAARYAVVDYQGILVGRYQHAYWSCKLVQLAEFRLAQPRFFLLCFIGDLREIPKCPACMKQG